MVDIPIIVFLNTHGVSFLVLVALVYTLFVEQNKEIAIHIFVSVASVIIFTVILKELFLIPRPYLVSGENPYAGLTGFSSLPSTHTAIAFALATSVVLHKRKLGVIMFILAFIVGAGRIIANVHYPIDVFVGILIGLTTGTLFDTLLRSYKKKWKKLN